MVRLPPTLHRRTQNLGEGADALVIVVDEDVDRLRRQGGDEFPDRAGIQDHRHEKAIRACFGIGDGAVYAFGGRHARNPEIFVAADQHGVRIDRIHRSASGGDSLHCQAALVHPAARPILDRETGHSSLERQRDVLRHLRWIVGEAVLEVGVDRQVRRVDEHLEMRKHLVAAELAVFLAGRPGRARAGRRDGPESEPREANRASGIPRVGDDEEARLVKPTEDDALLGCRGHAYRLDCSMHRVTLRATR